MNALPLSTQRSSDLPFAGKVAIVTGASRGMGAATARLLAARGASVVITARTASVIEGIADEINTAGGTAIAVASDMTDYQTLDDLVSRTVEHFGGLDFAFNNAGVANVPCLLADLDDEEWDRVIDTNLRGTFVVMRAQLRAMLAIGRGGSIVNNTSTAAVTGAPNVAAYVASKHAIAGLTRAAALEYADKGIRVNALATGYTRTEMYTEWLVIKPEAEQLAIDQTPMRRMATPEEIAEAAIWLLSDASSFVTGTVLPVDGGFLIP